MTDKHRKFRVSQDFDRHTAKQYRCQATPSVRRHDDEITSLFRRNRDDCFVGLILFDLHKSHDTPLSLAAPATSLKILVECASTYSAYSTNTPGVLSIFEEGNTSYA